MNPFNRCIAPAIAILALTGTTTAFGDFDYDIRPLAALPGYPNLGGGGVVDGRTGNLFLYSTGTSGTLLSVSPNGAVSQLAPLVDPNVGLSFDELHRQVLGVELRDGSGPAIYSYAVDNPGTGFKIEATFNPSVGQSLGAPVPVGNNLVTVTGFGGSFGQGSIEVVNRDTGVAQTAFSFNGAADGGVPGAGLVPGPDGYLYGTTTRTNGSPGGTLFRFSPTTGEVRILHRFTEASGGLTPNTRLSFDSQGRISGTTFDGGAFGYGTDFQFDPRTQAFRTLKSFTAEEGHPLGGVVIGAYQDDLLGLTTNGIVFDQGQDGRFDVLLKLASDQSFAGRIAEDPDKRSFFFGVNTPGGPIVDQLRPRAVPEPSSIASLIGGIAIIWTMWKRRGG